ncbi:hypothetical protein JOQ06_001788 [Pogonophryne albipinna]|uniref:Amino acid transporter n=1 Tax=Pogonophryne albipinna TaxID=1090488 RepID=A0AAD6FKR8_9TELE|nr:hypothetical protein JOQ06_001788 [Pogonophryne albipinna]
MFPANLVQATFQQYRTQRVAELIPKPTVAQLLDETTTRRVYIYGIQDDNGTDIQNFSLDLTPPPDVIMKTSPGTSEGMNVLGIVIFSATMGIMLGRMGPNGSALVNFCQSVNEAVLKIVAIVIWYFPFGIVFLVAGKILEMDDPSAMGKKLGFYAITVVMGLVLHGLFILPAMYFFITKKSPIVYIRGILQALLISLATSSSSATLPITFKCLLENNHIDRRIIRFVLPVGATINMDGTALYEAVAAIFIAQVNNYELDFGQIITIRSNVLPKQGSCFLTETEVYGGPTSTRPKSTVAHSPRDRSILGPTVHETEVYGDPQSTPDVAGITATAASIGAAGIPQAGLVTMVIVLTSVGLPTDDITLIIAVDWALDRFRTMVNVMGDALATGIMAHICRKDFVKEGEQVPLICETKPMISIQQMMTYQNQKNGCFQPPPPGSRQDHYHQEVARLMQLEEGFRPLEKKKHAHPSHHKREHRDKDHCSVDMNGLETNV